MHVLLGNYLHSTTSAQGPSAADFPLDIQEAERRSRGLSLRLSGSLRIVIGSVVAFCSLAIPPEATHFDLLLILLFTGGVAVICLGVSRLRLSRQYLVPNAEQLLQGDPRPPVVYLRPFNADDIYPESISVGMGASEEEQLALAMNELGPFVAIGRPYDILPQLGAARVRVSDEQWQAKVAEWVSHAQLVVLRVGLTKGVQWEVAHIGENAPPEKLVRVSLTKGVHWEVAHIVENAPPEKLVLLLPFTPATGYETFREQMREHFKRDLPKIERWNWTPPISVCGLMFFSAGWEPHFVELKRPLLNRLARVLEKIGDKGLLGVPLVVTLIIFVLQPRYWLTTQYKRAFQPVIEQLNLRWEHPAVVHRLRPHVTVPLSLFILEMLFVFL